MHLTQKGWLFWVPTQTLQPLVTHLGRVSTLLSYHARGSPLDVALSWVVYVPGSPSGGMGTSRVRLPLLVLELWPWNHLFFLFITVLRHWGLLRCRPLHGLSYPWVPGGDPVDALTKQRLILAKPTPGDASLGDALIRRRFPQATLQPGDASSGQPVDFLPWKGPLHMLTLTLIWLWSTPGDGTVHIYIYYIHIRKYFSRNLNNQNWISMLLYLQ